MKVYFDNAATTMLNEEVIQAMLPYMRQYFGNPSSSHSYGRITRHAVENARKTIADLLHALPAEIFFTSGGTEADNMAIFSAVRGLGIKHVVSSQLEHHAVLNTLKLLEKTGEISLSYVSHDARGNINMAHLESLLKSGERSFVSIMHGNNEVGNLNDIALIGDICKKHDAVFHTDTVQTMGHYAFDLSRLNIHFLTGSAHKFHGPKGVGFLYVRSSITPLPMIYGGSQEGCLRAGTENVAGIIGLSTALQAAYTNLDEDSRHVSGIKRCCIESLRSLVPGIAFNANSANEERSMYSVLSVSFPEAGNDLLARLDLQGIAASGGSACNSAHPGGSHVLKALNHDPHRPVIRFSFSKYNAASEVEYLLDSMAAMYKRPEPASFSNTVV